MINFPIQHDWVRKHKDLFVSLFGWYQWQLVGSSESVREGDTISLTSLEMKTYVLSVGLFFVNRINMR